MNYSYMQNKNYNALAISLCKAKNGKALVSLTLIKRKSDIFSVKCNESHEWQTTIQKLEFGNWCWECFKPKIKNIKRKPEKINEVKRKAEEFGGRCLSDNYVNSRELLSFRCREGHEWKAPWCYVRRNRWCKKCKKPRKENEKYNFSLCEMTAQKNFGKCFPPFIKSNSKIEWECYFGHKWWAKPKSVIYEKTWCPTCSTGTSERICRIFFETIFNEKFPKLKPEWLKNSRGFQLELDGYCEKLGIAFEHNGIQHYQHTKFSRGEKLNIIKNNDREKYLLCKNNNVKLIIIPALGTFVDVNNLKFFIKDQCLLQNINFPVDFSQINIDESLKFKTFYRLEKLEEIKKIAESKNGKCLSDVYLNCYSKLDLLCNKCGNKWKAPAITLVKNWCRKCFFEKSKTSFDLIKEFAKSKNGLCLSQNYVNSKSDLVWQCELGHVWNACWNRVNSAKSWCPDCFNFRRGKSKKLDITVYQTVAKNKGGKCLSLTVSSAHDKLEWQCAEDHIWTAKAYYVKNTNKWCPICVKLNKRSKSK